MLFFMECKKVMRSLTFVIYCAVVLLFYFTQFVGDSKNPLPKPVPGLESYGIIVKEVPEILMPTAIENLIAEYVSDGFTAYPYGFYKKVKLKEKDKTRLAEIIYELSGFNKEYLDSLENFDYGVFAFDENGYMTYVKPEYQGIKIPETLTYEHFRELMREVDKIIGGGSQYSDSFIVENFSFVPMTYEDALAEYEQFIYADKITGAYARLYCDYLGIVLSIMPVFVAAALVAFDKRSRMEQLAYSRKISSARLVFTRYFALLAVMLLPIIFTALHAYLIVRNLYPGSVLDSTAFLRYGAFWLIPNIMSAAAVGMIVTELFSAIVAIFVQGAWWFASTMGVLSGGIGKFQLVMRHNTLMEYDVFAAERSNILFNRSFFTAVSIIAVILTAVIYELKRRGIFSGYRIGLKNNKRKFS